MNPLVVSGSTKRVLEPIDRVFEVLFGPFHRALFHGLLSLRPYRSARNNQNKTTSCHSTL